MTTPNIALTCFANAFHILQCCLKNDENSVELTEAPQNATNKLCIQYRVYTFALSDAVSVSKEKRNEANHTGLLVLANFLEKVSTDNSAFDNPELLALSEYHEYLRSLLKNIDTDGYTDTTDTSFNFKSTNIPRTRMYIRNYQDYKPAEISCINSILKQFYNLILELRNTLELCGDERIAFNGIMNTLYPTMDSLKNYDLATYDDFIHNMESVIEHADLYDEGQTVNIETWLTCVVWNSLYDNISREKGAEALLAGNLGKGLNSIVHWLKSVNPYHQLESQHFQYMPELVIQAKCETIPVLDSTSTHSVIRV